MGDMITAAAMQCRSCAAAIVPAVAVPSQLRLLVPATAPGGCAVRARSMASPPRLSRSERLAEQDQVFVLVVEHVDQVDEALLRGNRAVGQLRQIVDDPVIETPAQFQIIHHRRRLFAQVVEGESRRCGRRTVAPETAGCRRSATCAGASCGGRSALAAERACPATRNAPG